MKVLTCLAATPGEVVTKETLMDTQWRSSIVSDAALARCISQIRVALCDDSKNPRYIETVPKVGYRLIARVRPAEARNSRPAWKMMPVGAMLLTAALMMVGTTAEPPAPEPLTIEPVEIVANGILHDPGFLHASARVLAHRLEAGLAMYDGRFPIVSAGDATKSTASAAYRLTSRLDATERRIHFAFELTEIASGSVVCRNNQMDMAADVFDVATKFSDDVGRCLGQRLSQTQIEELARVPTRNVLAYDAFQKAQNEFSSTDHATLQNAVVLYERAIDEDPSFGLAWAYLAYSLEMDARRWRGGRIDDMNRTAERALALAPKRPEAHYVYGRVRALQGDFDGALRAYEHAIELDPNHIVALYAAGALYLVRVDFDKAEESLLRTLQLDPHMHSAMSLLGHLYLKMGDLEKARLWLSNSIREVPLKIHANSMLAVLDLAEGQYEQARQRCERLNRSFPDSYHCLQIRGLVSLLDTDWETAGQLFNQMAQRWPEDEYSVLGHAQVLMAESKEAEAEKLLDYVQNHSRERVEAGERSSYHRWTLAAAYALKGEHQEALIWLDEAAAAGRREHIWDLVDPMFSELRNTARFQDYITATRVMPDADTRISASGRHDIDVHQQQNTRGRQSVEPLRP